MKKSLFLYAKLSLGMQIMAVGDHEEVWIMKKEMFLKVQTNEFHIDMDSICTYLCKALTRIIIFGETLLQGWRCFQDLRRWIHTVFS